MVLPDEQAQGRRISEGYGSDARPRRQSIQLNRRRLSSMGGSIRSDHHPGVSSKNDDGQLEHKPTKQELDIKYKTETVQELKTSGKTKVVKPVFKSKFHELMFGFGESKLYSGFILAIILLNTGFLIAQTWQEVSVRFGWYCTAFDSIFLGIYIMEMVIKIYIWRRKFFKEGWNNLDFAIVLFGTVDFMLPLVMQSLAGSNGTAVFRLLRIFRAIRAIRALRVLRTIRFLATLQVIMTTLLQSIRSIGAIVALITLFMYMFAVVGRGLYADADEKHFGNIFRALFTLFQLLTLDDWFEIYQTVSQNDPGSSHIIFYLLMYIVVEYFIFLNLFVAVLVDNFQLTLEAQNEANKRKKKVADDSDEDEEYLTGRAVESDSSSDSEPDVETPNVRKTIKQYFPNKKDTAREQLHSYYTLLAALENNNHILANQQRILDMMVDMCNECSSDQIR